MLPTITIGTHKVTRLICGGNPFSGFSHISAEADRDFLEYYTMPNLLAALDECWANGINTFQSRGDRHQTRLYLEHKLNGGRMQWIAQTASEWRDLRANIRNILRYGPIALYHHGTYVDNLWHAGRIDEAGDVIKFIKDQGLPAGMGSHIPEVIHYAEDKGWETDFYMCSLYNLARGPKLAVAEKQDPYRNDVFHPDDPDVMGRTIRQLDKPVLAFKVMAAGRNCTTPEHARRAIERAFALIKPADAIVIGMFQKYRNQIRENSEHTRSVLGC